MKKQLALFENAPYYSIVVFYGDCVLKDISFIPNGTFLVKSNRVLEVLSIIIKNNAQFQFAKINEVVRILKAAVLNGESKEIQNQHIEYIKEISRKDTKSESSY